MELTEDINDEYFGHFYVPYAKEKPVVLMLGEVGTPYINNANGDKSYASVPDWDRAVYFYYYFPALAPVSTIPRVIISAKFPPVGPQKYPAGLLAYTCGDPIDAITGGFLWHYTDMQLYGKHQMDFTRYYNSASSANTAGLGPNWSHAYDYTLDLDKDYAYFTMPDGSGIPFTAQSAGGYAADGGLGYTLDKVGTASGNTNVSSFGVNTEEGVNGPFVIRAMLRKAPAEESEDTYETAAQMEASLLNDDENDESGESGEPDEPAVEPMTIEEFAASPGLVNNGDKAEIKLTDDNGAGVLLSLELVAVTDGGDADNGENTAFQAQIAYTENDESNNVNNDSNDDNEGGTVSTDASSPSANPAGTAYIVTAPDGTRYYFDNNKRVISVYADGIEKYKYTYDTSSTMVTGQYGASITMNYNVGGKITSVADSNGNRTSFTYDAAGNLKTSKNPDNNSLTYYYDNSGNMTRR